MILLKIRTKESTYSVERTSKGYEVIIEIHNKEGYVIQEHTYTNIKTYKEAKDKFERITSEIPHSVIIEEWTEQDERDRMAMKYDEPNWPEEEDND